MYTQKIYGQLKKHFFKLISEEQLRRFTRRVLYAGSLFSLTVYAWVRLMFHDFPFEVLEETGLIMRTLITGWFLTALCIGGFNLMMLAADNYIQLRKKCSMRVIAFYFSCKNSLFIKNIRSKKALPVASIESQQIVIRNDVQARLQVNHPGTWA